MKSLRSIESLRGWLAWWVVLGHGLQLSGVSASDVPGLLKPIVGLLWNNTSAVHVFIIVSGFVITHVLIVKHEGYSDFILRRFFRLFPIYVFCIAISILVTSLYVHAYIDLPFASDRTMRIERIAFTEAALWPHTLLHLTLLHGAVPDTILKYAGTSFLAPAWSLSLEWQYYLIAPFLFMVARAKNGRMLYLVATLVLIKAFLGHQTFIYYQNESVFFLAADFFVIGILSRIVLDRMTNGQSYIGYLLIIAALLVTIEMKVAGIWLFFYMVAINEMRGVPMNPPVLNLLARLVALNRPVAVLGKWSYSTYLVHIPIFAFVVGGYVALFGAASVNKATALLLLLPSLALVAVASWALYHVVEKPFMDLGRRCVERGYLRRGAQFVRHRLGWSTPLAHGSIDDIE